MLRNPKTVYHVTDSRSNELRTFRTEGDAVAWAKRWSQRGLYIAVTRHEIIKTFTNGVDDTTSRLSEEAGI
jgi:hypothetical protein